MSDAIVCNHCSATLLLDARGDDVNGEKAAWIVLKAGQLVFDACSRSCATEILADGSELARNVDAWLEVITEIARTINEDPADPAGRDEQ